MHISRVTFRHYKAFQDFSITLSDFDVLVGPNNSGKSTVLGAFRVLSEGIRKANARKAELIEGPQGQRWGYRLDLRDIPVSLENVFHNYDESQPALITFHLENNSRLILFFPEKEVCFLIPESTAHVNSPAGFKRHFPVKIGFVPVLGPVEHEEPLYQKEAARQALLTHRASRNFRNIWHHYPEGFSDFKEMVRSTWPGMDIEPPQLISDSGKTKLVMFCPEERIPREIYWAGFGFHVWCQMLTFILKEAASTLLVIDEPDIYLHSDLQRQLVHILRDLDLQIVIATHSVEIITEVESKSLLTIHKKRKSATRISRPQDLQTVYQLLGSNANPVLTQLAKTRRALFLEGKDFQLLSLFARKLKLHRVANRSEFAVIPIEGFNPQKVKDFSKGIEVTLGVPILKGVIFDRDYRSSEEIETISKELKRFCSVVTIHKRKEIENFLLKPSVLDKAIKSALLKRYSTKGGFEKEIRSAESILTEITDAYRNTVLPLCLDSRRQFVRRNSPGTAAPTIDTPALEEFDKAWGTLEGRLRLVPGKEVLSRLNTIVQEEYGISLTMHMIVDSFSKADMDSELMQLMNDIRDFSVSDPLKNKDD